MALTEWYYHSGDEQFGPYEEADMVQLARDGKLKACDNVWTSTLGTNWVAASTVEAFFPGVEVQEPGIGVQRNGGSIHQQVDVSAGAPRSPVMQYLGAADALRQAKTRDRRPSKPVTALIALLVIGGMVVAVRQFSGAAGSRGARIDSLVAAGGIHLGSGPRIWVHLEFTDPPKAGDAKDVKLVLSSDCFKNDLAFDWAEITEKPTVPIAKGSLRRKPAEGISSSEAPRLNYVFGASFPIPVSSIENRMDLDSKLQVKAELYWAGDKKHSKKCSVRNWYVRE